MLRAFEVSVLADIRTIPRSRHNPQFEGDALGAALHVGGIRYVHIPELGGLRRARGDSPNKAWRNASFRGYADYMLTEGFEVGIAKLRALATEGTVAMMCAEAVPWRCHRSLVADALTARGVQVAHIMSETQATPHRMTKFALVEGTRVTYPGPDTPDEPLGTRAPFHLEATVRVLQRRAASLVDVWEDGRYLRVLQTTDGLVLVGVLDRGTVDEPDVRFEVLHGDLTDESRAAVGSVLRRMLGLDVDPLPLQQRVEAERRVGPKVTGLRGMRPPRFAGLFETFARVVPFQQLSLDAGVATVRRLVERFGDSVEHAGQRRYAFPTSQAVADARIDALRACGLSLKKSETLRHVARAIAVGDLTEEQLTRMSSAAAIRFLDGLPGIGPWSAGLVLLRGLGRLDVFPAGDVGAARGLSALTGLSAGPSLDRVVERFGDYRGYLYFCALGHALQIQEMIHPAPLPRRRSRRRGRPS
jgi:DNA-3-methyladenine glycosylase II